MSTAFEPGAAPAGFIPLSVPEIRGNEWKYVKECLDTGWVSSGGSFVERFERDAAGYVGTKHAVACVNGTSALHIALLVAGVLPDDEVVVSSLTFIAPVNAVRYARAWPVFMDSEPAYWQMDVGKAADFLEKECLWKDGELRNKVTRRRVAAILPVHVLGHPVDMDPLIALCEKFRLALIEDATESLGAKYKRRPTGAVGDIGVLSFNGNKVITTGGGGMLVTNNETLASKARYLTTQAKDDPVEYVHNEIGYNYRLTNVQAAMGCAQMEMLTEYIVTKRRTAAAYDAALSEVAGLTLPRQAAWAESNWWLYTVLVDHARYGEDSRGLLRRLAAAKIQTRPLWQPCHLSPAHLGCQAYHCDVAERLNREALSLPSSVGLRPDEQQRVINAIARA